MTSAYENFAALHVPGDPLIIYNCWDPGSAVAIAKAGAKAIATGSYGAAGSLGFGDGEKVPLDLVFDNAKRIIGAVELPVSIDFESGYANNVEAIEENFAALAATGAAGCNFEDSIIGGEGLYNIYKQGDRIRAAREGAGDAFFINARIDFYIKNPAGQQDPALLDETVERATAYLAAGASGIFVPFLRDLPTIEQIVKRTGALINVLPGAGETQSRQLAEAGVARISYGGGPWFAAMAALEEQARKAIDWRG